MPTVIVLYPTILAFIWIFNIARSILTLVFTSMPIIGPSIERVVVRPKKATTKSGLVESSHSEDVPPTRFAFRCHPRAKEVAAELDDYFLSRWPFKNQKEKNSFIAGRYNMWACMAFPLAHDDRIHHVCKLHTLYFLLDGMTVLVFSSHSKQPLMKQ